MDPQQEAFVKILQQSAGVIEQARSEQGWTAGAVALVLVICILGLAWMVRRLCHQVDEFASWRTNVLQNQVEGTTRALNSASTGLQEFKGRMEEATVACQENTNAVRGLKQAIESAPCGVRLT